MDSGGSSRSLLSRGNSEIGSRYVMESGVYMSSFAAAILVASLVAIGILMLTMVVALSVMLASCQRSSSGYFEQVRSNELRAHCNSLAFYAELNRLGEFEYPAICKQHLIQHIDEGQYLKDLNFTLNLAESYFSASWPNDDGLDLILVDADDIFISNINYSSDSTSIWSKRVREMKNQSSMLVLGLLVKLQERGWCLRFFTRNSIGEVDARVPCLRITSSGECYSMIVRPHDENRLENWDYISRRRVQLHDQGFHIVSIISCRMDAFQGPRLGKRNFKLACPNYHTLATATID